MSKTNGQPRRVNLASIPRELRSIAREAWDAGWTIRATNAGRLLWEAPNGQVLRTACTPSDKNVAHQVARTIKRRHLMGGRP